MFLNRMLVAATAVAATLAALTPPSSAQPVLPTPTQPAILPAVPDVAPGYTAPRSQAPPAGELIGLQQTPFVGIKLEDAVTMALQKNTDLAIAQANQRIANFQIVAAEGTYDVRFQLQPSYQHQVIPATSSFQAGPGGGPVTQDSLGATASFSGTTANGGRYSIGESAQRLTTNSVIQSFSPQYFTAVQLQFTQPLLRGRTTDDARRQILLAGANAEAQRQATLAQASQVITNVTDAYWDLVAAWRNVAIQEEGLRNAQAQAASTQRLAQQGASAPVDVIESNTQINVFQDNVLSALLGVQRLQTQLKSLILANPADPTWMANLVPTSNVGEVPPEPKLDDLIVQALIQRPEIAQLRASRRTVDANLAYARDQLKPQLDLGLGYTTNGFAGTPTDPAQNPIAASLASQVQAINALIARANAAAPAGTTPIPLLGSTSTASPGFLRGGFGTSVTNLLDNRFPTYQISLTLQLPLRNRTAKAQYDIAQEQGRALQIQELALLQRIRGEATLALQTLRSTEYRLVAARDARAAAESVLASEQRKFAAGASTTFLVLQRQLDLANQRGRELQAQTDLNKAVAELNRVSGNLFAAANFNVDTAGKATLDATAPTTSVLPSLRPGAEASPPPPRR